MKYRNRVNYPESDIKIAVFAKALGHPARIAILRHLASAGTCLFKEISEKLPLADSTVSQHMAELRKAGLINGDSEPPRVKYSIDHKNWKNARKYLKEFTKIPLIKDQ